MKQVSGKEFSRIIEKRGWELNRIQGSHYIYKHAGINYNISIPRHGSQPLKMGLLKSLMKLIDIKEEEL